MNSRAESPQLRWKQILLTLLAVIFFLTACGLVSFRASQTTSSPGQVVDASFDKNSAFRDFHNAVYYPVRAFLTGENPYSPEYLDYHPDGLGFPAFYPSTLAIHAPYGFLHVEVAQWLYLVTNFVLLLLVVLLALKFANREPSVLLVFAVSGVMVLTRPGVLNFYGVQVTLLHVLGCLMAIEYGQERPKLAALGLFLASCKPTFTIPLAILMLCRKDFRAVFMGTVLSLAVGGVVVALIAQNDGGLDVFLEQAKTVYLSEEGQPEIPQVITSWTRLDAYSIFPRWELLPSDSQTELIFLAVIVAIGGLCVLAEQEEEQLIGSNSRFGLIAVLTILVSVYHQPYDALLLLVPLTGLLLCPQGFTKAYQPVLRWTLIILLAIPMINFASTRLVLNQLDISRGSIEWKIIVTTNAIALLIAFALVSCRMLGSRLGYESR